MHHPACRSIPIRGALLADKHPGNKPCLNENNLPSPRIYLSNKNHTVIGLASLVHCKDQHLCKQCHAGVEGIKVSANPWRQRLFLKL